MKRQKILIGLFLLLMIGCIREPAKLDNYKYFNFTGKTLNPLKIEGTLLNSQEEGEFKFYNGNEIISEGRFEQGLRIGLWKYYSNNGFEINWRIYNNQAKKIAINYPAEWEVTERESSMFFARLPKDSIGINSYFILLSHNKDSLKTTVDEYVKMYYNTINNNLSIESYVAYKMKIKTKDYYYFEYTLYDDKKEQRMMLLDFITNQDDCILDFTYVDSYNFEMKDKTIFFQLISSCFLYEKRIFSPLEKISKEKITIEDVGI